MSPGRALTTSSYSVGYGGALGSRRTGGWPCRHWAVQVTSGDHSKPAAHNRIKCSSKPPPTLPMPSVRTTSVTPSIAAVLQCLSSSNYPASQPAKDCRIPCLCTSPNGNHRGSGAASVFAMALFHHPWHPTRTHCPGLTPCSRTLNHGIGLACGSCKEPTIKQTTQAQQSIDQRGASQASIDQRGASQALYYNKKHPQERRPTSCSSNNSCSILHRRIHKLSFCWRRPPVQAIADCPTDMLKVLVNRFRTVRRTRRTRVHGCSRPHCHVEVKQTIARGLCVRPATWSLQNIAGL
jgi:hypothetical protein